MIELHSLTGAYALNALDPVSLDEEQLFAAHLADCPDCSQEVASFAETAAVLSEAVATAPRPELRARVLSEISGVRQLPPLVTDRAHRTRKAPWLVVAAAAAVVAVGVGAAVTQPWQDAERTGTSTPGPSLTATQQVIDAPDAERVALDVGDARATVVRSKSLGRAVIVTEDMPAAPSGSEYVLWLQSPDGDMIPAGVMPAKTDQTVALDGDATEATAVGITAEPAGSNAQAPSSDPIAVFELG